MPSVSRPAAGGNPDEAVRERRAAADRSGRGGGWVRYDAFRLVVVFCWGAEWSWIGCDPAVRWCCASVDADFVNSHEKAGATVSVRTKATASKRAILWSPSGKSICLQVCMLASAI
jgi:hypothetical protein